MYKTAMAQLLAQLKLQLGAEKVSQMIDDAFWMDLERQQIVGAFDKGCKFTINDFMTGVDYYESKYIEN